jgi:hypothetical protein
MTKFKFISLASSYSWLFVAVIEAKDHGLTPRAFVHALFAPAVLISVVLTALLLWLGFYLFPRRKRR